MRGIGHYCLGLAAGAMCLLLGGTPAFGAEFYVYQLPDGSRMVTDQKQLERGYRLVQVGIKSVFNMRDHKMTKRFD